MAANMAVDLKIDWATHEAAKYACVNWHYSKSIPVGKLVKIGAWENGCFVGSIIFSWGANNRLGQPYGLLMTECCELVRVALTEHESAVSRIISIAIKFLKSQSPKLRLIVSFADPVQGHHGGIYQAGNWLYLGKSKDSYEFRDNGRRLQKRAYTGENYGNKKMTLPVGAIKIKTPGKHRYLMPLDDEMRKQISQLAQPYPKRSKQAMTEHHSEQRRGSADLNAPNL